MGPLGGAAPSDHSMRLTEGFPVTGEVRSFYTTVGRVESGEDQAATE